MPLSPLQSQAASEPAKQTALAPTSSAPLKSQLALLSPPVMDLRAMPWPVRVVVMHASFGRVVWTVLR